MIVAAGSGVFQVERPYYRLLLCVVATRRDAVHFLFIAPMASLTLSWSLGGNETHLRMAESVRPLLVIILVVAFTSLGFTRLLNANSSVSRRSQRGVISVPAGETALGYLDSHITPGEGIFVYPYYPTYYYLTAASNPTAYDFMDPGQHVPQQFQEALSVIAKTRPRVVLFEPSFHEDVDVSYPSTPIRVLASRDPLAEFILAEYRPCAVLVPANGRNFIFMVRKDLPCPEALAGGAAPKHGDPKAEAPPLDSAEPREPIQDAR